MRGAMLIFIPVIVMLLIFLSSFFSAAEMAFVSVGRLKVQEESLKGRKNALVLEKLLENPDEVVSAIVIGNNLADVYVPLEKVVSVPETGTVDALFKLSAETGYSRFPVSRRSLAKLAMNTI